MQLHDPHQIMRLSGSMPLAQRVEAGSMAAFFVPDPHLARSALQEQLGLAEEELWAGGRAAGAREQASMCRGAPGSAAAALLLRPAAAAPAGCYPREAILLCLALGLLCRHWLRDSPPKLRALSRPS